MTRFIRALAVLICIFIFGIGSCILSFILFPIGSVFVKESFRRGFYTSLIQKSWKFFTLIMQWFGCIKVYTEGDFSKIRGKIVVASHPSFIDIVLLIGLLPRSVCIAKNDLMKNPILRNIVKNAYIINGINTEKFLNDAKLALNDGYNIVIFPTGTRTKSGEKIKVHKGAAQLAITSGADIIPVKIDCDYNFLQKNSSMLDAGEKTVVYKLQISETLYIKDFKDLNLSDIKLRNFITEKIKQSIN